MNDSTLSLVRSRSSNRTTYLAVLLIWLIYAILTLKSPTTSVAKYNLSPSQTHLLQLTVILPLLIIWLVAAYGALRFRRYAQIIKSSSDGKGVSLLSYGITTLVIYLLASTLISSIAPYFAGTDFANLAVVVKNYVPLVIAFTAFALLYLGSLRLTALIKAPVWPATRIALFLIPFTLFAVFFTWGFYLNPNFHEVAANGLPYFVTPRTWLLFTYVFPYLLMWFLGCLAALNIRLYAREVKGSIYRTALLNMVAGIGTVVSLTIALQLLSTISSSINHLKLASVLLLVYLLVLFYALGYALIALGSKKLSRIEEVQ